MFIGGATVCVYVYRCVLKNLIMNRKRKEISGSHKIYSNTQHANVWVILYVFCSDRTTKYMFGCLGLNAFESAQQTHQHTYAASLI